MKTNSTRNEQDENELMKSLHSNSTLNLSLSMCFYRIIHTEQYLFIYFQVRSIL